MAASSSQITEAKTLQSQLSSIDIADPSHHRDVISKCQSLINALQDPGDKAMETVMSFTTYTSFVIANELGIFARLSHGPLTARQLAEQSGADALLITRLARVLIAHRIVEEQGPESYAPTPASNMLAKPAFEAGLRMGNSFLVNMVRFPKYLKDIGYRNPDNHERGPFQFCFDTELGPFDWMNQHPTVAHNFNLFMTMQRAQQHWTETFPVLSGIFDGVTIRPNAPLVVDVAGGFGHDLLIVKSKLPPVTKGQLVLEDRDSVIDTIPADMYDADLEYVKTNFFTPQPVKGARIYTIKAIIHNWHDHKAIEILRNVASAMTPGYSKIWLLEFIVPETNVSKTVAGLDMTMMMFLAAMERTKQQWYELLEKAGLEITKVETGADGFGLIEAMLRV